MGERNRFSGPARFASKAAPRYFALRTSLQHDTLEIPLITGPKYQSFSVGLNDLQQRRKVGYNNRPLEPERQSYCAGG